MTRRRAFAAPRRYLFASTLAALLVGCQPQDAPPAASGPSPQTPERPKSTPTADEVGAPQNASQQRPIADDGVSLWTSPTAGQPAGLERVAQSGQCLIILRPQQLWQDAETRRMLRALGLDEYFASWIGSYGWTPEQLERLVIALVPNGEAIESVLTGTLTPAAVNSEPAGNWNPQTGARTEAPAGTYYQKKETTDVVWLQLDPSPNETSRQFVAGPQKQVEAILDRPATRPRLRREFEALRQQSDRQRMVTVITNPFFVRNRVPEMVNDMGSSALAMTAPLWDLDCRAASASLHLSSRDCFVECHWVGNFESQQRIASDVASAKASLAASPFPIPGFPKFEQRWSSMASFIAKQTRVQRRDEVTTATLSLPPASAHNLALAATLHWHAGDVVGTEPTQTANTDLIQVLQTPIEFAFAQQSLEFAMRDLATLVRETVPGASAFKIALDGPSLQKDGITRNQQIANFSVDKATVSATLTQLVRRADPSIGKNGAEEETTVSKGKLIWTSPHADPKAAPLEILITTRSAAEANGYRIPRDLR